MGDVIGQGTSKTGVLVRCFRWALVRTYQTWSMGGKLVNCGQGTEALVGIKLLKTVNAGSIRKVSEHIVYHCFGGEMRNLLNIRRMVIMLWLINVFQSSGIRNDFSVFNNPYLNIVFFLLLGASSRFIAPFYSISVKWSQRIGFLFQINKVYWWNALTELFGQQSATLHWHNSLLLHITLITSQDDLCIVPGVGLYLGWPGHKCNSVGILIYSSTDIKATDTVSTEHQSVLKRPKDITLYLNAPRWPHRCWFISNSYYIINGIEKLINAF